jgi:hypothetical protein
MTNQEINEYGQFHHWSNAATASVRGLVKIYAGCKGRDYESFTLGQLQQILFTSNMQRAK